MLLSDVDIKEAIESGQLDVEPLVLAAIQPASIDIHIGYTLRLPPNDVVVFDPEDPVVWTEEVALPYLLYPGQFVLGSTLERLCFNDKHAGQVDGISSLGRLGLIIHSGSTWIDPGFEGNVTLEMTNTGPRPIQLRPMMRIGQLAIHELKTPAAMPYGVKPSKYQGQSGPTSARGMYANA